MLKKVLLSTDVTLACVQHALSTEKEEIMGLLIGEVITFKVLFDYRYLGIKLSHDTVFYCTL